MTKTLSQKIRENDKALTEEFGAEAFDDFDCRPENSYPEANRDAVTLEHVRRAIEERRRALAEAND